MVVKLVSSQKWHQFYDHMVVYITCPSNFWIYWRLKSKILSFKKGVLSRKILIKRDQRQSSRMQARLLHNLLSWPYLVLDTSGHLNRSSTHTSLAHALNLSHAYSLSTPRPRAHISLQHDLLRLSTLRCSLPQRYCWNRRANNIEASQSNILS